MDAASRSPSESPGIKVALILDADAQVGAALSSVLVSEGWSVVHAPDNPSDRLIQFFREMTDLPDPEREDVATAFREMLINAIEHGGNFDPSQYVEVSYVRTRKSVMCRIKDPGQGF